MNKRIVIIIVLILVIAAAAYGFSASKNNTSSQTNSNQTNSQSQANQKSSSNSSTAVQTNTVSIENMAFSPSAISVKKGTTVTWTNKDTIPHTVTETDSQKGPGSANLNQGDKYSFTFDNTGTFHYHCSIHTDMLGSVTVTE